MVQRKGGSQATDIQRECTEKEDRYGSCPLGVDAEFLLWLDDPQTVYQTTHTWVPHLVLRLT